MFFLPCTINDAGEVHDGDNNDVKVLSTMLMHVHNTASFIVCRLWSRGSENLVGSTVDDRLCPGRNTADVPLPV